MEVYFSSLSAENYSNIKVGVLYVKLSPLNTLWYIMGQSVKSLALRFLGVVPNAYFVSDIYRCWNYGRM